MSGFLLLAQARGNQTSPVIIPVGDSHYAAASDIEVIKNTLIGMLLTGIGWLVAFIITRFFKKQDSDDGKMDEIIKIMTRLETNVNYLERVTVKKEDLAAFIRTEMEYRDGLKE